MSDEIFLAVGLLLTWPIVIYLDWKNRRLSKENLDLKLRLNDMLFKQAVVDEGKKCFKGILFNDKG